MTSLSKLVTTSLEVSRSGGQEMTRGPGWDKIGVEQFFRNFENWSFMMGETRFQFSKFHRKTMMGQHVNLYVF